jgi:SAM-dependent methyltransferase
MQNTIIMPSNHNAEVRSITTTSRWLDFWNAPDEIFVHPAHMRRHFHRLTEGFFRYAPQVENGRLLDYGCGEALAAERFTAEGLTTLLYDRSDYYRELVRKNYAGKEQIVVLDDAALEALPERSLDYMLLCSVIQYLDDRELQAVFQVARSRLKPGGLLILADVIPPHVSLFRDVYDLLRAALRGGYLLPTVRALASLPFSKYRRARQENALRYYAESELRARLKAFGFSMTVAERNFGWSDSRKTYLAEARTGPQENDKN